MRDISSLRDGDPRHGWVTECVLSLLYARRQRTHVREIRACGYTRKQVQDAMTKLVHRGLAERRAAGVYALTDAGRLAEEHLVKIRSGPSGPFTGRRRPPDDSFRGRLWQALRRLHKATLPELVQMAATGEERDAASNAQKYLRALKRAGVVAVLPRRVPGVAATSPGFHRYLLVDDPGPRTPIWHPARREVYDPNTHKRYPFIETSDE